MLLISGNLDLNRATCVWLFGRFNNSTGRSEEKTKFKVFEQSIAYSICKKYWRNS